MNTLGGTRRDMGLVVTVVGGLKKYPSCVRHSFAAGCRAHVAS